MNTGTVMRIIKLKIFPVPVRLHTGYANMIFVIILPFFPIFKNVVHSLELGETPGPKLCTAFLNIAKHFKPVRLRLFFSIYLCSVLYFMNLTEIWKDAQEAQEMEEEILVR